MCNVKLKQLERMLETRLCKMYDNAHEERRRRVLLTNVIRDVQTLMEDEP